MKLGMLLATLMVIVGCTGNNPTPPPVDTDFVIKGLKTTLKVHKKDGALISLDIAKKQMSKALDQLDK